MCLPLCYCASKIWKKNIVVVLCMDDESFFSSGSESVEPEIEQASGGSSSMVSLLEQLKCPTASDLARKCKISTNPPKKLKQSKGAVAA